MSEVEMTPVKEQEEQDLSEILQIRRDKLSSLVEAGQDPFVITKYAVDAKAADIVANFEEMEGKTVSIAGRMMSRRGRIDGNAEARLSPLFSRPFSHIPLRRARPGFPSFPFPAGGEAGRRLSAGYPAFLQWL